MEDASAARAAREDSSEQKGTGHRRRAVGWLIILGDGLHNLVDGLAIGAAFTVSNSVGLSTTLAVILHEVPHEIGEHGIAKEATRHDDKHDDMGKPV